MRRVIGALVIASSLVPALVGSTAGAATSMATCASITQSLVKSEGFTGAVGPTVTPYNYSNVNKNSANALGTTIDFGAKALVVGCVSPSDIAKLAVAVKGKGAKMTAKQYMTYMVQQSAGSMAATPVAGTTDYLDFGSGKEDGLGSTMTMSSVRLDAWVAGGYIFLGFSGPVTSNKASAPLVKFIQCTEANY